MTQEEAVKTKPHAVTELKIVIIRKDKIMNHATLSPRYMYNPATRLDLITTTVEATSGTLGDHKQMVIDQVEKTRRVLQDYFFGPEFRNEFKPYEKP